MPAAALPTQPLGRTRDPRAGRIEALDGLRALAITLVVAFHAGLIRGGGIGVTVFFVLSGYLITGILIAPRVLSRAGLVRFWTRRLLRLLPALAAVCVFCAAWAVIALDGHARSAMFHEVLASLAYVQDLRLGRGQNPDDFGYLGHTWSLAVEQQFYMLWPLLLAGVLAVGRTRRAQAVLVLGMAGMLTLWRAHLAARGVDAHVGMNIDARGDSLLVGCALALATSDGSALRRLPARALDLGALGALGVTAIFAVSDLNAASPGRVGYLIAALCGAVLVAHCVAPTGTRVSRSVIGALSCAPVAWLGRISYSLYLWHPVVLRIARDFLGVDAGPRRLVAAPLLLAVTLGTAWLSYRFIEVPFQQLPKRLGARRAAKAARPLPGAAGEPV